MPEKTPQPDPSPKRKKATKAEVQGRVKVVLDLRIAGAEFADIVQYASENEWNVGERMLWNYVAQADKMLARTTEKNRGKNLRLQLAQRRLLYAKAVESGDWRAALAVKKDEAELLGLYDPPPTDTPAMPLSKATDLVAALAQVVNEVHAGRLDPRTGGTVAQMIGTQIRVIETGNLEARLEMLEQVLKQRNGDGKR